MTVTGIDPSGVDRVDNVHPWEDRKRRNTLQNHKMNDFAQEKRFPPHRAGWTCPPCPPLADWLSTLRDRGITATVDNQLVHLDGSGVTGRDIDWLTRHHDALLTAAAGTHPDWWTGVTTGEHQTGAALPDIGCAVLDCPGDTDHYSDDGIPFCDDHNPDWWWSR